MHDEGDLGFGAVSHIDDLFLKWNSTWWTWRQSIDLKRNFGWPRRQISDNEMAARINFNTISLTRTFTFAVYVHARLSDCGLAFELNCAANGSGAVIDHEVQA